MRCAEQAGPADSMAAVVCDEGQTVLRLHRAERGDGARARAPGWVSSELGGGSDGCDRSDDGGVAEANRSTAGAEACFIEVELVFEATKHIVADETTVAQVEQRGALDSDCTEMKLSAAGMACGVYGCWLAGRVTSSLEAVFVEMDQIFEGVMVVFAGIG